MCINRQCWKTGSLKQTQLACFLSIPLFYNIWLKHDREALLFQSCLLFCKNNYKSSHGQNCTFRAGNTQSRHFLQVLIPQRQLNAFPVCWSCPRQNFSPQGYHGTQKFNRHWQAMELEFEAETSLQRLVGRII